MSMGRVHRIIRRDLPVHRSVESTRNRHCILPPIKKCPQVKKAVYQLVKSMVEWSKANSWDEENNWLLEGRTVLIFEGGDRKDPVNYRPITYLPTVTKMVTLAIHKRMRKWLFGNCERNVMDLNREASGHPNDARRWSLRIRPRT